LHRTIQEATIMSTDTTTQFDLATFVRTLEQRDAEGQLALYADDAEVTLADRITQPGSPRVLHGKGEIRTWVEDVCARDMTHRVTSSLGTADGAAFIESCRYADGTNVLCAAVLELRDGRIAKLTGVQAWDE
jgi:ketosteroid isomerase-like protein